MWYNRVMRTTRKKLHGTVIIPPHINVWEHEIKTAQALAAAGYAVKFIPKELGMRVKSADVMVDDMKFEMKAPKSARLSAVERNLKRAYHQSTNIIFDSRRIKNLSDRVIEKELRKQSNLTKKIKCLLFVNRSGSVLIIK